MAQNEMKISLVKTSDMVVMAKFLETLYETYEEHPEMSFEEFVGWNQELVDEVKEVYERNVTDATSITLDINEELAESLRDRGFGDDGDSED